MCDSLKVSRYITVLVRVGRSTKIGKGACKGVRLRLNAYQKNTVTLVHSPFYCYYGDAKSQPKELVAVDATGNVKENGTDFIPCNDLNEVFVNLPPVNAQNWPAVAYVQVAVYE